MFPLVVPAEALDTPVPIATDVEDSYKLHRRFDRMGRLVGDASMERLFATRVMVVGLGGVGSFATEALVRSGIGKLDLVDFDKVCVTNTNRQLQAMKGTIGKQKAQILADRAQLINPQADVTPIAKFYDKDTSEALLASKPDFIVDCIDNITAKCHLLANARAHGIRVVSAMGAAGRMDPLQVKIADLSETKVDPFADAIRRILYKKYDFPYKTRWDIPAVYSMEPPREPIELHYDNGEGFRCVCPGGKNDQHSCEERRVIYGTSSFVTGVFGMVLASVVVRAVTG
ncbi:MAG: tRNA threonylcarbamoyladenosine dehydratase [Deltaproteobacteria bacterium]|nr:tRNA threonylcarbamoyladenosine dehydratase [Deltaproteobacteria bacterium]